ncbi:very short patch repair endonuclease [Taklimakanibacter deserti]|uniref:very short patch repair endonuclease n=1 Tax=Taklimakanibacter deserti TaxID=2267839 RepID=UPI000E652942
MKAPTPRDPKRSALMSRVRQRGTATELEVAVILRNLGYAYRLNVKSLPGSPDFANRKRKWAIFVNGCFWHHHSGCRQATIPKTNKRFWRDKFLTNRQRDAKAIRTLRSAGFRVAIVWACKAKDDLTLTNRLSKLLESRRIYVPKTIDH